jgi:hypothetical protein
MLQQHPGGGPVVNSVQHPGGGPAVNSVQYPGGGPVVNSVQYPGGGPVVNSVSAAHMTPSSRGLGRGRGGVSRGASALFGQRQEGGVANNGASALSDHRRVGDIEDSRFFPPVGPYIDQSELPVGMRDPNACLNCGRPRVPGHEAYKECGESCQTCHGYHKGVACPKLYCSKAWWCKRTVLPDNVQIRPTPAQREVLAERYDMFWNFPLPIQEVPFGQGKKRSADEASVFSGTDTPKRVKRFPSILSPRVMAPLPSPRVIAPLGRPTGSNPLLEQLRRQTELNRVRAAGMMEVAQEQMETAHWMKQAAEYADDKEAAEERASRMERELLQLRRRVAEQDAQLRRQARSEEGAVAARSGSNPVVVKQEHFSDEEDLVTLPERHERSSRHLKSERQEGSLRKRDD